MRRLASRRRAIFEAIEMAEPWRHVAVAMRDEAASEAYAAMAEAAARLDHPGIARLVAVHGDAIAFAWAAGQRLDAAIADASPAERAEIAAQIAELVAHAHDRGVVLRDLKPGNLVVAWRLTGRRRAPHVTLVDLDLACVEGRAPAGGATGTWGWTAPEQAVLAPREIDRRADCYALGTTLAFALTCAPLFASDAAAVRAQILDGAARVASARMTAPMRALVAALISVDRAARPTAAEAVEVLRGWDSGPDTDEMPWLEADADAGQTDGGPCAVSVLSCDAGSGADDAPRSEAEADAERRYAAFRATVADTLRDELSAAARLEAGRLALRLGDRTAARRHAHAILRDAPDAAAAIAICARASLAEARRADAIARLDRIGALPAAGAGDVLAAEVEAMRPGRAVELAGDDPAALDAARALCGTWLVELAALPWHERIAWDATQPHGAAALADATAAIGVAPSASPLDDDVEVTAARIDTWLVRGELEAGRALLEAALAREPGAVALWQVARRAARASASRLVSREAAQRGLAAMEAAHPDPALVEAMVIAIGAVMRAPREITAWLRCADRLTAAGRAVDALAVLASCERVCGPGGAGPAIEQARASAWFALDELPAAIAAGRRAIAGDEHDAAAWHVLALAWIASGNGGDARNAARVIAQLGDRDRRAPVLLYYASLVSDEQALDRPRLAAEAIARWPGDPELALVHALERLAASGAETMLAALWTARPSLALSRSTRAVLRGLAPALAAAIEPVLADARTAPRVWAAALYYLATDRPEVAAGLPGLGAHAPVLAAEAAVQIGDAAALADLAPRVPDLAATVARRMR